MVQGASALDHGAWKKVFEKVLQGLRLTDICLIITWPQRVQIKQ